MQNLAKIIGPAPSEMTEGELRIRLSNERNRVWASLENLLSRPRTTKKVSVKSKKKSNAQMILDFCKEKGITVEQFLELQEKLED